MVPFRKCSVESLNKLNRYCSLLLADGMQVRSSVVLSNATACKTLKELAPSAFLPGNFVHAIEYSDYSSSGTTRINVAVDKLPQFESCKSSHPDTGPQHVGTIHIGSDLFPFHQIIINN